MTSNRRLATAKEGWLCPLLVAAVLACSAARQAAAQDNDIPSVSVSLSFSRSRLQLDGADGGGVCQFNDAKPDGSGVTANVAYSPLGGFPDDSPATAFGKFCETAFSTNGRR